MNRLNAPTQGRERETSESQTGDEEGREASFEDVTPLGLRVSRNERLLYRRLTHVAREGPLMRNPQT